MKNANFKLIPQQQEEFLEQNEQRASLYDIIIATDESQFHCYKKLLNEDGILVLKIPHLLLDISKTKEILESLGEEFRIKMPFYIPMSLDMQDIIFLHLKNIIQQRILYSKERICWRIWNIIMPICIYLPLCFHKK